MIPDFPETPEEKVLERALPRLLGLDSPHWLSFLQQAFQENTHPAALEPVAQQYLRMWQFTLWGKNWQEAGLADPWEAVTLWKKTPELTREIQAVLAFQFDRFTVLPQKPRLPYPCALEVYCNYSRDQIFAALGLAKPNSVREGVKYLHQKNSQVVTRDTDVFLVTLNKSEKEFSESTRYEDYSINDRLFHWQSQNATTPDSPTGQRYIHQREKGNIVLLFVRNRKKTPRAHPRITPSWEPPNSPAGAAASPLPSSITWTTPSQPSILPLQIAVGCCEKRAVVKAGL